MYTLDPTQYDVKEELKQALESGQVKKVEVKLKELNRKMDQRKRMRMGRTWLSFEDNMQEIANAYLDIIYEELKDELLKD